MEPIVAFPSTWKSSWCGFPDFWNWLVLSGQCAFIGDLVQLAAFRHTFIDVMEPKDLMDGPHRRWNPLTREWRLVSPRDDLSLAQMQTPDISRGDLVTWSY